MSITLVGVRNPKWHTCDTPKVDSDGNIVNDSDGNPIMVPELDGSGNPVKVITCEAQWSHLGDNTQPWYHFVASPNDPEAHGKNLYAALVNGDHGAIADE